MANYFENSVKLIGNLGQKPEVKDTATGQMATLQIATTKTSFYKDGEGKNQKREKTTWSRVVSFDPRVVKFAAKLEKGEKVAITGALESRSYEKDGVTHYVTEVVADSLETVLPRQAA